ncbi:hypothetical protein BVX98_07855, partial [bacterium F11]
MVDPDWRKEIPGYGESLSQLYQYLLDNKPKKESFIGFMLTFLEFIEKLPKISEAFHIDDVRQIHIMGAFKGLVWRQLPLTSQRALIRELSFVRTFDSNGFPIRPSINDLFRSDFDNIRIRSIDRTLASMVYYYRKSGTGDKSKKDRALDSVGFVRQPEVLLAYIDDIHEGFINLNKKTFPLDEKGFSQLMTNGSKQMRVKEAADIRRELGQALLRAQRADPKEKNQSIQKWRKGLEAYAAILDTAEWMPETFLGVVAKAGKIRFGVLNSPRLTKMISLARHAIEIQKTTDQNRIYALIHDMRKGGQPGERTKSSSGHRLNEISQLNPPFVIRALEHIPSGGLGETVRSYLNESVGQRMLDQLERNAGLLKGSLEFDGTQLKIHLKERQQAKTKKRRDIGRESIVALSSINLMNSTVSFLIVSTVWVLIHWSGADMFPYHLTPLSVVALHLLGLVILNLVFYGSKMIWGNRMPTGPPLRLYGLEANSNPTTTFISYNPTTHQFELNPALYWLLRHDWFLVRMVGHFLLLVSFAFLHENLHRWGLRSEWITYSLGHVLPISLITFVSQSQLLLGLNLFLILVFGVVLVTSLPPMKDWEIKPVPFLEDLDWLPGSLSFAGLGFPRVPIFPMALSLNQGNRAKVTKGRLDKASQNRPRNIPVDEWKEITSLRPRWERVSKETRKYFVQEFLGIIEKEKMFFSSEFKVVYRDAISIQISSTGKTLKSLCRYYTPKAESRDFVVDFMLEDLGIDLNAYTARVIRTLDDLREYRSKQENGIRMKIPWSEADGNLIKELIEDLAAQQMPNPITHAEFMEMSHEEREKFVLSLESKDFRTSHRSLGTTMAGLIHEINALLKREKIPKESFWYIFEKIGYLEADLPTLADITTLQDINDLKVARAIRTVPWEKIKEYNT